MLTTSYPKPPNQSQVLYQFFGSYFHQDAVYGPADVPYKDDSDILRRFLEETSPALVQGVVEELNGLIKWLLPQRLTESQVRSLLYSEYGCECVFVKTGESTEHWLRRLYQQLHGHI